jgi:hypothetical protein
MGRVGRGAADREHLRGPVLRPHGRARLARRYWDAVLKDHRPPDQVVRRLSGGGAKRDRTADLLTASQALSQLSYGPGIGAVEDPPLCKRERGANTTALAPPGISIVIVTFVARPLRPTAWSRSAGGAWRIRRCVQTRRLIRRWVAGAGRIGRGGSRSRSARGALRYDCELGRRLAVFARGDEQDSGDQEKADSEDCQPERCGRLFEHGRGGVVVVLLLVVPVTVRFVVRIAVATHGAAYFRFSGRGQADLRKNPDFPHLCGGFAGLTLLGRGP